ncbi:class I SAM-dependent methyltransferase [Salinibacillus xinjiangensis]|uniref:Methyltransferase domain-containing protein n=1 Tax=Salinibacillus xinjiangensis TaxID=1229268 RepID=A0A6G1X2T7_9BACI|nr:class I SAM-dependent methyltransferase [Salinibacillus xinjiangensis]MRG85229.1 methyltransferase domain-containing protein [Salinibacillus xinjiangensis]
MTLKSALQFSHHLLTESVEEGDFVVDATVGNGHDTVFLSKLVGTNGTVLGIDIQTQAIENTKKRLKEEKITNVQLLQDSHGNLESYIPNEKHGNIGGAVFNLGYLPGSDKSIITKPDSTIGAIQSLLPHLLPKKQIVLVVYYGHEGGDKEKDELLTLVSSLDQNQFSVLQYGFINQKNNPPFVVAIEKRKARSS